MEDLSTAIGKALRQGDVTNPDVIAILDKLFKRKDRPAGFHFRKGNIYRPQFQNDSDTKKIVPVISSFVDDDFTGRVEVSNWQSPGEVSVRRSPDGISYRSILRH